MASGIQELVGMWTVRFMQWTWEYTFTADGRVTWRDPWNNEHGSGRWALNGDDVNFSWFGSTTRETWHLRQPIETAGQSGDYVASYGKGEVKAQKTIESKANKTGPRLGNDGSIPVQFVSTVREAIVIAWKLNDKPDFIETFRDTVSKLSGRTLPPDVYALTLNKMVINLAETSHDARIANGIANEAQDIKAGNLSGPSPAFSFPDGSNIWIRKFSLERGVRAVVAHIFHEGAHLAGAPGDPVAEYALDVIHKKAGFPR
jgi:hypothetical protein